MALNPLYNERTVLKKLSEGDVSSFESIYDEHSDPLYHFTLKFVKSPELADDLTQEVFLHVWELREQMIKVDNLRAYLFTMCRNHVLNFLKKASRETASIGQMLRHYHPDLNTADDKLVSEDYRQFIKNVLDSLPAQTREVFRLCREEYKSYDEVAALLGVSRNAVKKHMIRSHKVFKDRLGSNPDITLSILILLFIR